MMGDDTVNKRQKKKIDKRLRRLKPENNRLSPREPFTGKQVSGRCTREFNKDSKYCKFKLNNELDCWSWLLVPLTFNIPDVIPRQREVQDSLVENKYSDKIYEHKMMFFKECGNVEKQLEEDNDWNVDS